MKKTFFKKPLFWILIVLALLATPTAIKVFELYVYSPQTEPAPEDFYVRSDDPPFTGMTPAPKEDVEVYKNNEGKTVVEAHKDGYKLVLDPNLHVYTREIEGGSVHVSNDDGCQAVISKAPFKTAKESHDYSINKIIEGGALELLSDSLEKIGSTDLNAYLETQETDGFGVEKGIIVEANGITYSISNAPHDCTLRDQILAGFSLE